MSSKQIVFADRLVGIGVQNGLVRLDLAVNDGQVKNKDGNMSQRMRLNAQLVLPLDSFAAALGMQQDAMKAILANAQKGSAEKAAQETSKVETAEKAEKADKSAKPNKAGK